MPGATAAGGFETDFTGVVAGVIGGVYPMSGSNAAEATGDSDDPATTPDVETTDEAFDVPDTPPADADGGSDPG